MLLEGKWSDIVGMKSKKVVVAAAVALRTWNKTNGTVNLQYIEIFLLVVLVLLLLLLSHICNRKHKCVAANQPTKRYWYARNHGISKWFPPNSDEKYCWTKTICSENLYCVIFSYYVRHIRSSMQRAKGRIVWEQVAYIANRQTQHRKKIQRDKSTGAIKIKLNEGSKRTNEKKSRKIRSARPNWSDSSWSMSTLAFFSAHNILRHCATPHT